MLESTDSYWYQKKNDQQAFYQLDYNKNFQHPGSSHVSQHSPQYKQYCRQVSWSSPSQIDPREVLRNVSHTPWTSHYPGYENVGPTDMHRKTANENFYTQYQKPLTSSHSKSAVGNYNAQSYNTPEVQRRPVVNTPRIRVRDVFSVNRLVDKEAAGEQRNEMGNSVSRNYSSNIYQSTFQEPLRSSFQYADMNTVSWRPQKPHHDLNTRPESCVPLNTHYLNERITVPNKSVGSRVSQFESYVRDYENPQKNNLPQLSHSFLPVSQAPENQFRMENNTEAEVDNMPQPEQVSLNIPRSFENNIPVTQSSTNAERGGFEDRSNCAVDITQSNKVLVNSVWKVITPDLDGASNQGKSNEKAVDESSFQLNESRREESSSEIAPCDKSLPVVNETILNKNLIQVKVEENVGTYQNAPKEESEHETDSVLSNNYRPKINREKLGLLIEFLEGGSKTEKRSKRRASPDCKENMEKNVKESQKTKAVENDESSKYTTPKKNERLVVESKRSEKRAQVLTKIIATPAEAKMINDMRVIRKSESHLCKSCNLNSPNGSFWINPVSGKVKCLNCFKKNECNAGNANKQRENSEQDGRSRKRLFSSYEDHVENVVKKTKKVKERKTDLKDNGARKTNLNKTKPKVKDDKTPQDKEQGRQSLDVKDKKNIEFGGSSGSNKDSEVRNSREKMLKELYKKTKEVSLALLKEH